MAASAIQRGRRKIPRWLCPERGRSPSAALTICQRRLEFSDASFRGGVLRAGTARAPKLRGQVVAVPAAQGGVAGVGEKKWQHRQDYFRGRLPPINVPSRFNTI